jgi:hypothetical protein
VINAGGGFAPITVSPALAEFYVRWPVKIQTLSGSHRFPAWLFNATELGSVRVNASTGLVEIYTSTATLRATGSIVIPLSTYVVIEVHVKIDNAVGEISVKVDGVDDATWTGDTQPGADTTVNIIWGAVGGAGTMYLDDLGLNDSGWG